MLLENIRFEQRQALYVRPRQMAELALAVRTLGLAPPRPVIVLIGGAGGIQEQHWETIRAAVKRLAQAAEQSQAAVLDGGTHSGVMAAIGQARRAGAYRFPLIGVAAEGTVTWPGRVAPWLRWLHDRRRAALDPNHTHFILVPGQEWGAESPWIAQAASRLAQDKASVAVLVNGGQISLGADLPNNLQAGRPVLAVQGSGRAADQVAAEDPPQPGVQAVSGQEELEQALNRILAG